jgi:hypothetical protein
VRFSEAAAEAIRLADARRTYWDTELPKYHPDYPLKRAGERSAPSPAEDAQLRTFLLSLPPNDIYKLILTMYLGRGDFGATQLPRQYASLNQTFPMPETAAYQMWGKGTLGDYLREGLASLKRAGIDLDTTPL